MSGVTLTNIFEALRADHDLQRQLADLLVKTEGDSDGRRELFDRLRCELAAHAAAEERAFYVPLIAHDLTQEKARHSIAEHHEMDELVESLVSYDPSGPQWLQTARDLQHKVTHHLDEEEREVFQLAGKALDEDAKERLALEYTDEMEAQRSG